MSEHEQNESQEERADREERALALHGLDRRQLLKAGGAGAAVIAGLAAFAPAAGARSLRRDALGAADFAGLKGKTLGAISANFTSEAPARSAKEAQRLGKQYGFKVLVVDGGGDFAKVSATMKTWAQSKKVDAIVSVVNPPQLTRQGLTAAAKAKIPVGGNFSGYLPNTGIAFDVASNEWVSTAKVMTYLTQRMDYEGGIAFLTNPLVEATGIRENLAKSMVSFYNGIKLVANERIKVPGQVPDAKAKAQALLQRYPKGQLKAIFTAWGEIGVAASQAVKQAGRKEVFVASIDGNLNEMDAIRKGDPYSACCVNDMEQIMATSIAQLAGMLQGKKPLATRIFVDAPFVTKHNVPPPGQYPKGEGLQIYYSAT